MPLSENATELTLTLGSDKTAKSPLFIDNFLSFFNKRIAGFFLGVGEDYDRWDIPFFSKA
ncbi:hypothetical protein Taitung242_10880 [Helicobacter pylori]